MYLRWGWLLLERTRTLSGIQFTTQFIEFFVVETKRFVSSFVNVILTRQTCGQRSSRAAESKRRAIGNYFFERICYMFLESKRRGDWDLALCPTLWLGKIGWQNPIFPASKHVFFSGSCHCASGFQMQVPKLCIHLDLSLLYILTLETYSKFARKNNFLALGVCFAQPCSSAGRRFCRVNTTFTKLPTNRFVSTTKNSMKCVVNWIPLRICVRSRNTQPHLNASSRINFPTTFPDSHF